MKGISNLSERQKTHIAVLVAALGYFVDIYDLQLFGVIRVASLKAIGLSGDEILSAGVTLLNSQMIGMLVGGLLWGILGDKRGRVQVLFGSILLYSLANIGNSFVNSLEAYSLLRFIAGVGLAGEVGAGITLVSEILSKESRGYSTTLVATCGGLGAVVAALVGDLFDWRTAYLIGGVMGLVLLVLRVSVHESGMFKEAVNHKHIERGNFLMLFSSRAYALRYLSCIAVAIPVWFIIGILMIFSPEFGKALGLAGEVKAQTTTLCWAIGISLGDFISGVLSQIFRSRKKVITFFVTMAGVFSCVALSLHGSSTSVFYAVSLALGFFMGYWAVFLTTAAEQFGTNLRSTVTSTGPNFVRGSAVLITLFFSFLKPHYGFIGSAWIVGAVCFSLAGLALWYLKETYGIDLNFVESGGKRVSLSDVDAKDQLKKAHGW